MGHCCNEIQLLNEPLLIYFRIFLKCYNYNQHWVFLFTAQQMLLILINVNNNLRGQLGTYITYGIAVYTSVKYNLKYKCIIWIITAKPPSSIKNENTLPYIYIYKDHGGGFKPLKPLRLRHCIKKYTFTIVLFLNMMR